MLYDTSDPYNFRLKSKIDAQRISWTVTDMDVDPEEKNLIYSSIDSYVRIVDLATLRRKQEFLDLSTVSEDRGGWGGSGSSFMSIKFSGDAKEIVGGTKAGEMIVYDLIANRQSTRVRQAHADEINSVCFADRKHSNLVFTGSDDSLVKIWDRRSLGNSRPAGVFVGHAEGITNVASKGDGIYVASNSKDQLLKVWDIRKMVAPERMRSISLPEGEPGFDYRYEAKYRFTDRQPKHPEDTSLFTFKGHAVYSTLIRCQFSPLETTGQRYVYTGSSDGRIHIYDLVTGETAQVLRKPNQR